MIRSVMLAFLVFALAALSHFGFDRWQQRDDAGVSSDADAAAAAPVLAPAGTPLAAIEFPRVDGRFLTSSIANPFEDDPVDLVTRADLVSGDIILNANDVADPSMTAETQLRNGQMYRQVRNEPWTIGLIDDGAQDLLDARNIQFTSFGTAAEGAGADLRT